MFFSPSPPLTLREQPGLPPLPLLQKVIKSKYTPCKRTYQNMPLQHKQNIRPNFMRLARFTRNTYWGRIGYRNTDYKYKGRITNLQSAWQCARAPSLISPSWPLLAAPASEGSQTCYVCFSNVQNFGGRQIERRPNNDAVACGEEEKGPWGDDKRDCEDG